MGNIKRNKDKNYLITDLLLSCGLLFTVLFFSPAEMYFSNKDEFVVDGSSIIVPLLFASVAAALINFAVLTIIRRVGETLFKTVSLIELGALLAFYVQLLCNGRMANIGWDQSVYLNDIKLVTANFFAELFLFILPLVIWLLSKRYKNNAFLRFVEKNMTIYLSCVIILMQTVGLVSTIVKNSSIIHKTDYDNYLSYDPVMSFSKDENVIVFLIDQLDGDWMDLFLTYYPNIYKTFDGFTYYRNNISSYTFTYPSIVNMLTCKPYNYERRESYLHSAWDKDTMIDVLKAEGWDVNLLVDKSTTYYTLDDLKGRCDNIRQVENMVKIDRLAIVKVMGDISMGKVVPYLFKPLFLEKYKPNFSTLFITYEYMPNDYMYKLVGTNTDLKFYEYFKKHGFNADNKNKKFTFVHFNGVHDDSYDISAINPEFKEGMTVNRGSTACGVFAMLSEYFDSMKELGVYDNSTIIVMADHGRPPSEQIIDHQKELNSPIITTLLVKPANAEHGKFLVDDHAEVSNQNLAASVLDYAGIETDKFGYSYRDIAEKHLSPERHIDTYEETDYIEKYSSYIVKGDARDINNWHIVE